MSLPPLAALLKALPERTRGGGLHFVVAFRARCGILGADMAAIYFADAQGNTVRCALPETAGESVSLGSAEGCHVLLPPTEGVADRVADIVFDGTNYVLNDTMGVGAVVVNEQAEASVVLVPGVVYLLVDSYTLTFDPETAAPEEGAAPAAPRLVKAALPAGGARIRRQGAAPMPLDIPAPKQENALLTLATPVYVAAILIASFVAGLSLRYWMLTGGYFPSDFFRR